jgi:nitrite reductase/ring-hydroxylating ferredoxin subunit/uncharacterized membrane protein
MRKRSLLYGANRLERMVARIENARVLDPPADDTHRVVERLIPSGPLKDSLTGTWLGHPAHPMFTDIPIGFWTSAFVLDLFGGRPGRPIAEAFVGLGVVSALPTVATGAADWADTTGPSRRAGFVHALANASAVVLYASSWRARRRDRYGRGVVLGMFGATVATFGAYLGGHLFARRGVGVDHSAFEVDLPDWTRTVPETAVSPEPTRVELDGAALVLVRRGQHVLALAATCPHRGGPLDQGSFDAQTVRCPWHGSCFELDGGALRSGPSAMPLLTYRTRVIDGMVEVRTR